MSIAPAPDCPTPETAPWRICVAPMMDWTDRHCRFFHRLLTRHTRLYTEMLHSGALLHGAVGQRLRLNAAGPAQALQLGGCDPGELARAAALAADWGYDEINLNCGCPSARVQRGAFGASLMRRPQLVADCVRALRASVAAPVTVKHRIGVDRQDCYGFVRDFVGTVAGAGCTLFIVHARSAWLQGISPRQNRALPPLRYALVHRLKADFPQLAFVINGGLDSDLALQQQLPGLDGAMIGRAAYHNPWWLARWDALYHGSPAQPSGAALTRERVEAEMVAYMEREAAECATPWPQIARHMLGLRSGLPGARLWRQVWSDHRLRARPVREVYALARAAYRDQDQDDAAAAAAQPGAALRAAGYLVP